MVKLLLALCLSVSVANAAVRFDGTSSRAFGYSSSTNLNLTNEITIAVWMIKEAGMAASSEFICKGRNDNGNKALNALRELIKERDDLAARLSAVLETLGGRDAEINEVTELLAGVPGTPTHLRWHYDC